MTKQQEQRQTAKIYMFPTRPRMAPGSRRRAYANQQTAAHLPTVASGACWYHEAAIEEAEDAAGFHPGRRH